MPVDDRRAQVVVEQVTGDPAKGGEGLHVTPHEILQRLVEEESQEEHPRVAQRHHESRECPARRADQDVAKACPVHLAFLAGEGPPPQEALARRGSHLGHLAPHLPHAQRAAPLPQHVPQPSGRQLRILRQHLAHEAHVGIETARPWPRLRHRLLAQRPLHRLVVQSQLGRNRSHRPVLPVVQLADAGDGLEIDHAYLLAESR